MPPKLATRTSTPSNMPAKDGLTPVVAMPAATRPTANNLIAVLEFMLFLPVGACPIKYQATTLLELRGL